MIERINGAPRPDRPVAPAGSAPADAGSGFADELKRLIESETGMRLSNHVQKRLERRQIELTPDDVHRLAGAVDRAEDKGSRESLVLMDDVAWVVSIRNKTLITAVDAASRRENVFTNIDSVVIA